MTLRTLGSLVLPITKGDPVALGRQAIRYIDIGSIDAGQIDHLAPIDAAAAPGRARQVVREGDTLFSTVRPYLKKIARVPESLDGEVASTGFCVLRPGEDVHPGFLFHFVNSDPALDQILPLQRGVSYPAVRDRDVLATRIDLPPLDEQRRIADILEDHLSRLDAGERLIIRSLSRASQLATTIVDSLLCSERLVPLSDVVVRIEAGRSFGASSAPAGDDDWGIIKVSAMTTGEFIASENKQVDAERVDERFEIRRGDILLSRANTEAHVGASVLVGEVRPQLLLSDKSLRIIPKPEIDPAWLQLVLSSSSARRQISALATGTKDSMRNIAQSALLGILVPYQSPEAQESLAVRADNARRELGVLRTHLDAARTRSASLRRALLTAAFSGQLTGRASDSDRIEELADASHDPR